ncbi:MAG: PD-(D/E)XK nuclease family protein [Dehalococcoidia bacterium]|nr:PD-(D/E)XK nuclease family protein [Dehalococcoidia bacterium]
MAGLTLITGGTGSGKTGRLVQAARAHLQAGTDLLTPLLVLVPTMRHADQFRRRLVDGGGVAFGLDVVPITMFARRHASGLAPSEVAAELLRRVTDERIRAGGAARFAPIAHTPGLHALVGRAVGDLVAEGVDPAAFRGAAETSAHADLTALADIYQAYRAALVERGWHDPRESAARAAAVMRDSAPARAPGPVPPGLVLPSLLLPGLVLVDGVQFLRSGEVDLVAAMAGRAEVVVALDPQSGPRAQWTAERLAERVPSLRLEALPARTGSAGEATVQAATAADAESQLREIARSIKARLAADESLRPSDFAVTFRQMTPHLTLARRVFAEFDLPLDPAAAERLTHRPFGMWVLRLLRLGARGWRAEHLADALRSGFLNWAPWRVQSDTADHLTEVARRAQLWSGRKRLGDLAETLHRRAEAATSEGYRERLRATEAALRAMLPDLDALLAPPARTPAQHAAAVDAALFGPGGLVRTHVQGYPGLDSDIRALRAELTAFHVVEEALDETPVPFDRFVDTLEERLDRPATLLREAGGVLLAPMHSLHGLRFHALYAGGLAEGEFPAPGGSPSLLDRRARERLTAAGFALPPEARATEDELWRTVVSRAEAVTSLWRPRLDAAGRPVAASYYFASATEAIANVPAETAAEHAASRRELALTLARGWRDGERRRPRGFEAWHVVRLGAWVEQRRRSWEHAGRFEGALHHLGQPVSLPGVLDADATWSASRIESYQGCPFHFFAGYGLHLSELGEEQESANAAARGTVIHKILEEALRPLMDQGLPLDHSTIDRTVATMRQVAPEIWERAPEEHSFGRAALWRYEMADTLDRIERQLRAEAAAWPPYLERVAGLETREVVDAPGADPPMRMLVGTDRLDLGPGVARIVDYKTGRGIKRADVDDGLKVQLQWYALGARVRYPEVDRVVAEYVYLRPDEKPWQLDTAKPAEDALITHATTIALEVRERAGEGRFQVGPVVDPCPSYCAFQHICRVGHTSRRKEWDA